MWFFSNSALIHQAIEDDDNVRYEDSDSYEESTEYDSDEDKSVEYEIDEADELVRLQCVSWRF